MAISRPTTGPNAELHWEYEGTVADMLKDWAAVIGLTASDDTLARVRRHYENPRSDLRLFVETASGQARALLSGEAELPADSWAVAIALAERETEGQPVNDHRVQTIHRQLYGVNDARNDDRHDATEA